ncbi:hypothetical protein G9A89_013858 [Geosiphon pyriformis]|nr:hypothetical protein G9A89_013858 [Geosiphon pyriformis]
MAWFVDSDYIGEVGLSNLKYYKYSATDKSPIARYILKPYWTWAVHLFPLWMAPNLITLCGLGFIIVNLICVAIWIPDLVGPGPSWLYFSFAAGLWLYSTFDNVDGGQARRTGTSSPLGELFDHGCDALNCAFGALVQSASMGLGHSWYSGYLLLLTTIPFYTSTWEEYHTGTLYLGYVNGPTEGLILACLSMIISGIKGPQYWTTNLRELYGSSVPSFIPKDYHLVDLVVIALTVLLLTTHIPLCFYNVYKTCKENNKSFLATAPQFFSVILYWLCGYLWLASPFSKILENQHFILFALTLGIVFGRIATKIILAHVTKMPFPMFTVMLIPLFLGALLTNIPVILKMSEPILTPTGEYYYLWGYFIFVVIAYLHWALLVINRFCTYLKISCLRIPRRKPDNEEEEPILS